MPNTREKLIKRLEQSLIDQETGREMRFVGGDTPIIANGVTLATDNNVGDKMTPTAYIIVSSTYANHCSEPHTTKVACFSACYSQRLSIYRYDAKFRRKEPKFLIPH